MTSRDDQSETFLNSDAMNDDFFVEIAEHKLNISRNKFKLRLVLLSPATGKNENYLAVLYRAKIKVEILDTEKVQSIDVIIKALVSIIPELKEFSVFPRERFMYENVLSSFEKIWLDRAGEVVQFGPQSIKFETDPYEILVLDDLKAGNFKMLNRKVGLNLDQTKMLLEKLAKFHAASAIRYQQDGMIRECLDRSIIPELPDDSSFVAGVGKMLAEFIVSIRDCGNMEKYIDVIEKWDEKLLMTQFIHVAKPTASGFQVLNHGDLWLNNMMFRTDADGNPLEVILLDFQMSFWAGPGADLWYFLLSSVSDDVKVKHFDDLIAFYHEQLSSALSKLKFEPKIPSLDDIYADLLDKAAFGMTCVMFILFVVKFESDEELNMQDMMSGANPELLKIIYNNDSFKNAVKSWLPFLHERGYLDKLITHKENGVAHEE